MFRRDFLKGTAALLGTLTLGKTTYSLPSLQASQTVKGRVINAKTKTGIPNVLVSNGLNVTKTDQSGNYQLPLENDSTIFVVKPRGYQVPVDKNNLPQNHYHYVPNGSPATEHEGIKPTGTLPKSVDFNLNPVREDDNFSMILFGDPQPRNQTEIDYMSHDIIEQIVRDDEAMKASFGLSLGDIMFDNLEFYDPLNQSIATIGKPWQSVVGNHDLNFDSPDNALKTETFRRIYGPNYYAFQYGAVNFVVLDNVMYHGKDVGGYHGEITYEQLAWLKNLLRYIPKDQLLVIAMHIPIWDTDNRQELYRLIEDRPHTLSFSAHTHYQRHVFLSNAEGWQGTNPHHHLNHATVCGCWWGGAPDERGIPHATMSDGGPNGYSIVEFNKANYKITFRPASRPFHEQMAIYLPEETKSTETSNTEVVINVFAGSSKSIVEARINNSTWTKVANAPGPDPYIVRLKTLEAQDPKPPGRAIAGPTATPHIWKMNLPANLPLGTHLIDVRTIDMFGQTYTERRTFRVIA
ncbi:MAG: calcineurin-like phosphoesterase C-terminal domain-containing protein [Fimbriimonadaceae bacterium]